MAESQVLSPSPLAASLLIPAADPPRRRHEPVTCGIPWPQGLLADASALRLRDAQGTPVPLQVRPLDHWPDGSVRWALLDWQADVNGEACYSIAMDAETPGPALSRGIQVQEGSGVLEVDTGPVQFHLHTGETFLFRAVGRHGGPASGAATTALHIEEDGQQHCSVQVRQLVVEEQGPLRAMVRLEGQVLASKGSPLLDLIGRLHFFSGSAVVRLALTLRNPRRAEHPGGLWDLGDGGSVYLRDVSLTLGLPSGEGPQRIACSPERGCPMQPQQGPLEVYQDSSGGPSWRSHNHMNRHHQVPNSFCGYRLRAGGSEQTGRRATPIVSLTRGPHTLGVAMAEFWQNFPKAVEAEADTLTLRLFPRQYADLHEIQGGEQKTHTCYLAFATDDVTEEPLAWCRAPLLVHAPPAWYCSSGALPYLTPRDEDPNTDYLRLVDAAITGDDTFDHKREVIDEYGWRHFGDIYGDHEAVFHHGPEPLVSHYNNQYDPVAGFAYQFLRSGDARWWRHMEELAQHVIDIDIYHTEEDKSAYNNGLFWHTYHYVDADTGTHRSYPRAAGVCGGGPANEHNYATGLRLHYFLTGSPPSREAAIALARHVIDSDDGNKTIFRWLARGDTGLASSSRTPDYHGPGRGAANSVAALLDGYQLTRDAAFLAKAEQLIRRCIHPADDIAARNLLDAENRWFYTMFLQVLGGYLDFKIEQGEMGFMYAYARESLLQYARWMAEHERPYLERPETLEYPTETWAAQDMRKSEVFKYAAKHARGGERARFLERSEFFFRYSTGALSGMPTRTLARPVVLLLRYGPMHAYFQRHPETAAPPPKGDFQLGLPERFVPQKARAKKRLRALVAGGLAGFVALAMVLVWYLLREP